jgi:hypothetical protein
MAARKKTAKAKPEAVPVNTICSVCGLPWHDHGEDPTTDDCIRLLKAELARRPLTVPVPHPYPVPVYPKRPWYWEEWYHKPYQPYYGEILCKGGTAEKTVTLNNTTYSECTPKLISTSTSPLK